MVKTWYNSATDTLARKGFLSQRVLKFVPKPEAIDLTLCNFLTDDYPQFIGEILLPLCSEFKLTHHCNWKNYSKSCTNHIMDYLELMNHSCHDLFGESYYKTSGNFESSTMWTISYGPYHMVDLKWAYSWVPIFQLQSLPILKPTVTSGSTPIAP